MSSLVLTDLHMHGAHPFSRTLENGLPSRFQDSLNILDQAAGLIEVLAPSDLILGGDLFHRRNFIKFQWYNLALAAVYRLSTMVTRTWVISGNHDYENDNAHALEPFQYMPNVTLYDQPARAILADGTPVQFLPYLHDASAMARAFEQAPSDHMVVSHYAAAGCPLESDYFLDAPIKLGELARFPRVIFGHVHKPSEQCPRCGSRRDGSALQWGAMEQPCPDCEAVMVVAYVGATQHFDFGDAGQRGALFLGAGPLGLATRYPLHAPMFITTKYPRVSAPTGDRWGYLRILGVPVEKQAEYEEAARRMGWLDVVSTRAELPVETQRFLAAGLKIDRAALETHVALRCPDLDEAERVLLVDVGEHHLRVGQSS